MATNITNTQIIKNSLTEKEKNNLLKSANEFIKIFGDKSLGQKDTPKRVVKLFEDLLVSKEPEITVFDSKGYDEMIIDNGIKFYTFCEHHILPIYGTVKIGYIPDKKIIGLSKLTRIVDYFSKRLNTQEYFTQNIANYLNDKLKPKGVGVVVRGYHLCKMMRGVKNDGEMITSKLIGIFLEKQEVRQEFLSLFSDKK